MPTAFDQALELQALQRAAEAYALRHGEPGSAAYRAAWLSFRGQIQSLEDLERVRALSARRRVARSKTPEGRATSIANGAGPRRQASLRTPLP